MAKQTFTTGQVLTAAQMTSLQQTAMGGGSATAKTASYTLVAADAGTTVAMNAAGATTITVNTGLFAAGDTVFIQNLGAGACTVTAGTATVATAGSLILPQNDAGILYFTSASAAIFYDYIQAGAVSPLTTKGDLYTFSTSDARLGVGANGTTLVADSSEAVGLRWAATAGLTLISEQVAAASSGIDFTSISGSFKQLLVIWSGAVHSTTGSAFTIRLNADSDSNYAMVGTYAAAGEIGVAGANNSSIFVGGSDYFAFGQSATSDALYAPATGLLLIDNYSSSTKLKTLNGSWGYFDNGGGLPRVVNQISGVYNSTTAITQLNIVRTTGSATLTNLANTSIRLYGVN